MEEHEYLQFLLRITEDIIINNYSKSEDIEDVFEHHIEINKERLNKVKMYSFFALFNIIYDVVSMHVFRGVHYPSLSIADFKVLKHQNGL